MEDIVSSVVPTSEGVYEWHLSTGADIETQTNLSVKGRANSKERPYVYLYGEEADKTASDVHNICILNFDCLRRLLHKQLLVIGINQKIAIQLSAIHNNPLAQADENYGTPVCYSPQGNNFPETSSKTETYIITHYLLYHRICQITITKVGY